LLAEVIPVRTQDFEWTIGGNTFQDSKITKLTTQPNTPGISVGGISTGNTIQNHQVGYAVHLWSAWC
jgi:iron complex outermembrane receptor protein